MVEAPDGSIKVALELDGHDFHEKTKEQAAHDRARERTIIRRGYTIFRFTGSEVFRNARKCVEEVVALIASAPRRLQTQHPAQKSAGEAIIEIMARASRHGLLDGIRLRRASFGHWWLARCNAR